MSCDELATALQSTTAALRDAEGARDEFTRLVHELERHRVELQEQNRELSARQAELEAARARWADLFEFTPVPCFTLDARGRIREANAAAQALVGANDGSVVGKPFTSAVHLADAEAFWAHLRRCFVDQAPVRTELRLADAGKTLLAVSAKRTTVTGRDAVCSTALVDVTDRARASELQEGFGILVDGVLEYAIVMLAPDGTVQTWNSGAERLYGCSRDEVVGKSFATLAAPGDRASGKPQSWLSRASAQGREKVECWCVRRDGSRFFARIVLAPLRTREGRIRGYALVTRDLSDRKRTEVVLRKALELMHRSHSRDASRTVHWVARAMASWGNTLGLTPSEMVVAELLLMGLSNKEIARQRGVSVTTVRSQVSQCFRKARVDSRGEFTFQFFGSAFGRLDVGRIDTSVSGGRSPCAGMQDASQDMGPTSGRLNGDSM
ncbi:MAG TPA: PAS domain S-box protein [Planctomycetota bacterium]|nr:PAS domain S-box protein [Planctomycetota bacterium]